MAQGVEHCWFFLKIENILQDCAIGPARRKQNSDSGRTNKTGLICRKKEGSRSAAGYCQVLGQAAASLLDLCDKKSLRKEVGGAHKKITLSRTVNR